MKIIDASRDRVVLELSQQELANICDIVYTADAFYNALDPTPYELTVDRVKECASSLQRARREATANL